MFGIIMCDIKMGVIYLAKKKEQSAEDAFIAVGLTGEQYKVITETEQVKYKARFKILEAFQKWF